MLLGLNGDHPLLPWILSSFSVLQKARDIRSSKTFLSWAGSFLTGEIGTVTKYFRKIITANSELEGSPRMKVFVRWKRGIEFQVRANFNDRLSKLLND